MKRMRVLGIAAMLVVSLLRVDASLVLNPATSITNQLVVQPIIVSQAAAQGGATAEYFGDATQSTHIFSLVDEIYSQAGVDVTFLSANTYTSSFTYNGYPTDYSASTRPQNHLNTIFNDINLPVNVNSNVINMVLVDIVPGFDFTSENTANGLAFLGANGIAQFVGSNLLTWEGGREVVASVVAHEIGHNLGLNHEGAPGGDTENLMYSPGSSRDGERLDSTQITTILNSQYTTAIPEPSALMLVSLAGLLAFRRRRK